MRVSFLAARMWRAALVTALSVSGLAAAPGQAVAAGTVAGAGTGAPRITAVQARDHGALLSWAPPGAGGAAVVGYLVRALPGGLSVRTTPVTSYQVAGLTDGHPVRFTVAAVTAAGVGPASAPSATVTPQAPGRPGPVRSLVARAGFRQAVVSWAAPAADGGTPVTGYRLLAGPGNATVAVGSDSRSAVLPGLRDGVRYLVRVTAVNAVGQGSAAFSGRVVPGVTVPDAPTGVTVAPAGSGLAGVSVQWQPPGATGGSAVSGYTVTVVGTTRRVVVGPSARSATVGGLVRGHAYQIRVAAGNAKGLGPAVQSALVTAGGTVAAGTVVLSAASLAALTRVGTDGALVFAKPTAQVQALRAGAVVVAGVSTATPAGLLAEVTSVTSGGGTVTVSTKPASLSRTLSAASFGLDAALPATQLASFTPARAGVRLLPATASSSGALSLGLNTTLYQSSNGAKITVSGNLGLTPKVDFSAAVRCCIHVTSSFTATVTASATLKIDAGLSHDISGGYTLGNLTFRPISFSVLGVPVVIVPTLTVKLIARGSVAVGLSTGVSDSYTVGVNVTTDDASVTAKPISSHTPAWTPPTVTGSGSLSAAAGVEADASATLNGIATTTLTDSLWAWQLSVDTTRNPWWTLTLRNTLGVKVNLTLLGSTFTPYQKVLSDKTLPLAQASGPFPGLAILPATVRIAPGGTIQLTAHAAGTTAHGVSWSAPPGGGSVSPTGSYTAPLTPGSYRVTAAMPAAGLAPAASGTASIQVGAQPPGPPTGPLADSTSLGHATVRWTPPADTGGSPITAYTITAEPGNAVYPVSASATSADLGGLTPGTEYTFTVTASGAGGSSLPSAATDPVRIDDSVVSGVWTGTVAPLPSGVPSYATVQIKDVTCSSPLTCTAVGTYSETASEVQGLLLSELNGSWTAVRAPLPADAETAYPQVALSSVACASPSSCVAVGTYRTATASAGLLLSGAGSTWTAAKAPVPPGGLDLYYLNSVACPSTSACVAGGMYRDGAGNQLPLVLSGSGSSWQATRAPLPADALAGQNAQILSVACPSTKVCVAAGVYLGSASEMFLLSGSGTGWTATAAPLPAGDHAYNADMLFSVACAAESSCVAVGHASFGPPFGLLETGAGTAWTPVVAPQPGPPSGEGLTSITCPSVTSCIAVGTYGSQGVVVTGSGTSWTAAQLPLPADASVGNGQFVQLTSVACGSTSDCVAAGNYVSAQGGRQGLLLTGSDTHWSATEAPLLSAQSSLDLVALRSAACSSATGCVVVGDNGHGLIFTRSG